MASFSRAVQRWQLSRVAAAAAALAFFGFLAAFVFAAVSVPPDASSVIAAVAFLAIAGAGFLYAWREPGR